MTFIACTFFYSNADFHFGFLQIIRDSHELLTFTVLTLLWSKAINIENSAVVAVSLHYPKCIFFNEIGANNSAKAYYLTKGQSIYY